MRRLLPLAALAAALAAASSAPAAAAESSVEVVAELRAPGVAAAHAGSRALRPAVRRARLDPASAGTAYADRRLASYQRAVERRIRARIPSARVRWRYRLVLDALAVVVPRGRVADLARVPGVAHVYPPTRYRVRLDRSPRQIGADALWGAALETAGEGVKIGILDDGVDQTHPFFDPTGYAMPPGFPRGQRAYTSAKVIVARSFPAPGTRWPAAPKPFDPQLSDHGTHVAGIAAGNAGTQAETGAGPVTVSGVAPRAYLGNYKVLTVPTDANVGLDGNAPEIAAGIEAAVRDRMDVINLSLGEPEIAPQRDLVVRALAGAAAAGVVPVVAAGNDFAEFGYGSIGSPGTAPAAITVGAVDRGDAVASFSSAAPTPLSLLLKPDVSAPGVGILSSVPRRERSWERFNGTSMAAPHVAGGAALLRQRHPEWSVAQTKAALVGTAAPAYVDDAHTRVAPPSRAGAGVVALARADAPLVFAEPSSVSFGLLAPRQTASVSVALADAGGGAGEWAARVETLEGGVALTAPATVTVPGPLELAARAPSGRDERSSSGYVVLTRGGDERRVPFWAGVAVPDLAAAAAPLLTRTGTYSGDTRRGAARVSSYRYPQVVPAGNVRARLPGPEVVYRVRLPREAANFGVAVVSRAPGTQISPRAVAGGSEDRLTGYAALPLTINPYLASFEEPRPVVGAVLPTAGDYAVVFDTPGRALAGPFRFRFWVDDTTPPRVTLATRSVVRGKPIILRATDAGSGVDPRGILVSFDGSPVEAAYADDGTLSVPTGGLRPGRHRLVVQVSDYQELKNMEDVGPILPNTTRLRLPVVVRRAG